MGCERLILSLETQQKLNTYLCVLHFLLGFVALAPSGPIVDLATPRPVWLDGNGTDCGANLCTDVDYDHPVFVTHVSIPVTCSMFFGLTATAHALYATYSERYYAMVTSRNMWWRWVEYALSVPPMLVIICVLNGLTLDFPLLQSAALGSVTQFFGLAAEHEAKEGCRRAAQAVHALGYAPLVVSFLPVFVSLGNLDDAPSFVPFLIVSQLLFFSSFGFVQLWFVLGPQTQRQYAVADTVYLLLSAACKATLAGSVVAASFALEGA